MSNFVELVVTCKSWQEAELVADELLKQRLVACVEYFPIKSRYWWQGAIESADEIKLIMESVATNFSAVEAALSKIHSYETFVLQMVPVTQVSQQATAWWLESATPERL